MLGGLGHTGHQSWPPMDRWICWESWPPYAEAPTESQGKSEEETRAAVDKLCS